MKQTKVILIGLACAVFAQASFASALSKRKKAMKSYAAQFEKDQAYTVNNLKALKDYIKAGLSHNPGLKASFYKWKSELKKISSEFALPDPKLTFTKYLESVETRVGPQESAVAVSQMIPLPDKLWIKRKKSFRQSEMAYYEFESKKLELIDKITFAYYEYAYLRKAVLLTEENMKLLKNFEKVAQSKYASGLTKNQDLLKVQVELGKLENTLTSLNDMRDSIVAGINALLNLSGDVVVPWPDESLEIEPSGNDYKDIQKLTEELEKNNPKLIAMSNNVEKNKNTLALSRREFFPDLTVGVNTIETGPALNPSLADSGKDAVMVMATLNIPIWFNRIGADISASKSSLQGAKFEYENTQNELKAQLAMLNYKMKDSERQFKLYNEALLPKAVQVLNATKSGYETGKMDFLSLIDAQRMLLSFQLALYRHNADYYQNVSKIKTLIGESR